MFIGIYAAAYVGRSTDVTVFATTGEDRPPGALHIYKVEAQDILSNYVGRLFVDWGPGTKSWIQFPKNPKPITEIRLAFKEPDFPGFLNFVANLSAISGIPATWKTALKHGRGVYLLTCPRTNEWYIGAAYGEDGFLGRWLQYVRDGHGGNEKLRSRDPSDYQVSILEVAGSSLTDAEVIALEALWKKKLDTRSAGLNKN